MDYNENPIRVHTQCTYQEMKAFQNFNLRRPRWVSMIFFVFWIVGNIASKVQNSQWLVSTTISFVIGTGLIIFSFLVFNGIFYTKKRHQEATHLLEQGFFYEFRENGFVARNNTPDFRGQKEFAYDSLYRVYDRGSMMYIFTEKKNGLLVDLERVSGNRHDELRTLLKSKTTPRVYKG